MINVESACYGFDFLVRIVKDGIFPVLQIFIPIILIVLCTLDLGRVVIGKDDKENKNILKRIVKRLVCAILIFFFVTVVNLFFTMIGNITDNEDLIRWSECWNNPIEV